MGNPPCADIFTFASNALDTRRVRHYVHKPVSPPSSHVQTAPRSTTILMVYVYITRFFSAFFRKGQVIETFRGEGIYQPAVDLAIEKLRAGAWVRCVHYVLFVLFLSSTHAQLMNRNPTQIPYLFVQIHLFGEGKVCQSDTYKADPQSGIARLQRFRWGMCVIFLPLSRSSNRNI